MTQKQHRHIFTFTFLIFSFFVFLLVAQPAQAGCCVLVLDGGDIRCTERALSAGEAAVDACDPVEGMGYDPRSCEEVAGCPQSYEAHMREAAAAAGCTVGITCPAGQVERDGPCPEGSILCAPAATTSTSTTPSTPASTTVSLPNPLGTEDIRIVIGRIIQILMSAIGAIALMILIYGGFNWLTAMGNPEKIKKGKDIMLWTLIGVVIMFSSYFIVRFIIIALTKGTGAIPPTFESDLL